MCPRCEDFCEECPEDQDKQPRVDTVSRAKGVVPVAAVAVVVVVAAAVVLCKVTLLESRYLILRANILSQKNNVSNGLKLKL